MSQRTPNLQELLVDNFNYQTANMYTSIPGVVISVDSLEEQRITVQPTVNMRSADGIDVTERPPILNVPLHMPVTREGGLTYPISPGTPVYLIFSMRGLQNWKRGNGSPAAPSDIRRFDVRDCVAIPGIYPFSEARNQNRSLSHSVDDVVLVHNIGTGNEVEIRLKPNGDVFVNSPTKVTVNCQDAEINADVSTTINTEQLTVNGNASFQSGQFVVQASSIAMSATDSASMTAQFDMNGDIILNGKSLDSHDHGGVQSGGSRTDPFNA